jgi:hypothetical protein
MKAAMMLELAETWQLWADSDTGGDATVKRRETLRECADALRMLAEAPTLVGGERVTAMEDLLRSACAIADRRGEGTAWDRFSASVRKLGLNGITARTYRVLPSDLEP